MSDATLTECSKRNQILEIESWCGAMLESIRTKRQDLERWIKGLSHYLEGDGAADLNKEENVCQHARMVVMDGATLHCLTNMYVLLSRRPAPPEAWDAELAAEADRLLAEAPGAIVKHPLWRASCDERLAYARTQWTEWYQHSK